MANEFKHKDPGSTLTSAEFIAACGDGHIFACQCTGDILYASSATVLKNLAKGAANTVLHMGGSCIPAWTASPSVTDLTISGGCITLSAATDIDLLDDNASALSFDASGKAGIIDIVTTDCSEGVTMSGTLGVTGVMTATGGIELSHACQNTLTGSGGCLSVEGNVVYRAGGTDVPVADGGTGASTLTDGGVLLGSGTSAVTAMAVLADSEMIVGDGTTDPVAESGATLRTSIGVGTGDSPQFTGIELSHATANTLTASSGVLSIECNRIFHAGGTDIPVADGGTGASTFTANGILVGNGTSAIAVTATMATKGHLMIGDGSGVPSMLGVGSNCEVLTACSGEATGTKWAAAGGSGGLVLIGSVEASSTSTLTVTCLDGTYEAYLITINASAACDGAAWGLRLGCSGGIKTGASDYEWAQAHFLSSTCAYSDSEDPNDCEIQIFAASGSCSDEGIAATFWLHTDGASGIHPVVTGHGVSTYCSGVMSASFFGGTLQTAVDVTQFQIRTRTGNYDDGGRMSVWGLKHS